MRLNSDDLKRVSYFVDKDGAKVVREILFYPCRLWPGQGLDAGDHHVRITHVGVFGRKIYCNILPQTWLETHMFAYEVRGLSTNLIVCLLHQLFAMRQHLRDKSRYRKYGYERFGGAWNITGRWESRQEVGKDDGFAASHRHTNQLSAHALLQLVQTRVDAFSLVRSQSNRRKSPQNHRSQKSTNPTLFFAIKN
jgi:hypothetical protein